MKELRMMSCVVALCGWACVSMIGCGKQESQTPPAVSESRPSVEKAVSDAQKQAESQKATAQSTAAEAEKAVGDAAATASSQAQGMIDKVKTLIAEKKYNDAMTTIKELSALKLTPEQQKLVDDLKAQVQKALTSSAAEDATKKASEAAGGLLGK